MINKLQKVVSLTVGITTALSVTAFGMTLEQPAYNDGSVIIKGTGEPNKIVTLTAVKQGGNIRNSADIAAIEDVVVNADGKFAIDFSVDDSLGGGVFVANVFQEGGTIQTVSFEHSSEQSRETAVELLKAATDASTVISLVTAESQHYVSLKTIGIPCDSFNLLGNKTDVANMFNLNKKADMTNEQLAKCFSKACGIGMLNSGADKTSALGIINAEFEGKSWIEASDEIKTWIIASMTAQGTISSFADFDSNYAVANALYDINSARYTAIKEKVDAYASTLGIASNDTYLKYRGITDASALSKVNQALVTELSTTKAMTAQDFLTALASAVNTNVSSGRVPGSGGSGGGGGGAGGGGAITNNYQVNNDPYAAPQPQNNGFTDIDGYDWAKTQIEVLAQKDVIKGTGDNKFEPARSVTREEFVKMIVCAFMLGEQDGKSEFTDLPSNHWAYGYVISAVNNGLVNGISDSEFGTGSAVSRQDAAVIIDRAFTKLEKDVAKQREYVAFADESAIADYAKESIERLYCSNILNGKGEGFEPQASLTRAEAAVLIYGALSR